MGNLERAVALGIVLVTSPAGDTEDVAPPTQQSEPWCDINHSDPAHEDIQGMDCWVEDRNDT